MKDQECDMAIIRGLLWGLFWGVIVSVCILIIVSCNGNPSPQPEPKISWIETETETGRVVTVLKDTVPILRIYATDGVDGKNGIGIQGEQGIAGKDWSMPDTLYLKLIDSQNGINRFAVSDIPFPPEEPVPDSLYIKDVILEDGEWAYILRGDSLKLRWTHGYKDLNGRTIDPADLFFHVAYENRAGEVFSLKPFENVTQNTFLVMYGLPSGMDIIPAVAAFRLNDKEERRYSGWVNTLMFEYFVRRE